MKKILLFLLLVVGVFLVGCDDGKSIIGTWEHKEENYNTVYVYNKDGSGYYTLSVDGESEKTNFTYEIKEEKLIVNFDGFSEPFELEYRREKNKLYIKDDLGTETEFTKK